MKRDIPDWLRSANYPEVIKHMLDHGFSRNWHRGGNNKENGAHEAGMWTIDEVGSEGAAPAKQTIHNVLSGKSFTRLTATKFENFFLAEFQDREERLIWKEIMVAAFNRSKGLSQAAGKDDVTPKIDHAETAQTVFHAPETAYPQNGAKAGRYVLLVCMLIAVALAGLFLWQRSFGDVAAIVQTDSPNFTMVDVDASGGIFSAPDTGAGDSGGDCCDQESEEQLPQEIDTGFSENSGSGSEGEGCCDPTAVGPGTADGNGGGASGECCEDEVGPSNGGEGAGDIGGGCCADESLAPSTQGGFGGGDVSDGAGGPGGDCCGEETGELLYPGGFGGGDGGSGGVSGGGCCNEDLPVPRRIVLENPGPAGTCEDGDAFHPSFWQTGERGPVTTLSSIHRICGQRSTLWNGHIIRINWLDIRNPRHVYTDCEYTDPGHICWIALSEN